ncbi:MAG TPA: 3-oxoacyl-ACP reductase FabG [Smithellaceae bacterium]|jgi:NAD(P)-dependent dehydrogenase (short-subunit alcohol dehydrogenase family)|nr:3-oxoacyl-ACP reductase FabG [Syntrophaceae bacterium]HOD63398.1 3-oxoacyl-ACP reductase FabG [Smithellaceae bacterium]MBP8665271.1 3-oxoacyl-ACP reductase FabG [Syntrophaceae bacterium]HOE22366.1 3-oxoacyl-ACP reductase FabG [Smithellaceae bacterium]HOR62842.1 3-oxoacyl-ACP reductase FabG [Smithellaceae bacterium]
MRLKDKVAIVTGSGRGIGEGIVMRFAEEGAKIIVNDVNEADAKAVVEKIRAKGGQALAVLGSVADRAVVQKMVDTAVAEFGTLDIIVNNAGITRDVMLHKMTDDQWKAVIDVNLTGVYYGIQCAGRVMREKKYGKIINISSTSALGNAGQLNYSASKAGVIGMTKTAAKELGPKNVNVNAIAPGMIWTDMMKGMPPDVLQQMDMMLPFIVPLNRKGSPQDIANLALFLASDESAFITGQIIFCDGGMKM